MKWYDLIGSGGPEPQALNLIRTSYGLMWSFSWDAICTMLRRRHDGDSEVNWRHGMSSDIIYAYSKKGVMLDKPHVTFLLNNESLNNRLWWHRKTEFGRIFWTSDGFKSFKNNMSEVLPGRMLLGRGIKGPAWCGDDSFLLVMKLFVKVLHGHDRKHSHDACGLVRWRLTQWSIAHVQISDRKIWLLVWLIGRRWEWHGSIDW